MANERQISNSNESNQAAIDALGVRTSSLESTVDSSAASDTKWVFEEGAPNLTQAEGYLDLGYTGANDGFYIQNGPLVISVPNDKELSSIPGAERTFLLYTDASYSSISFALNNFTWAIHGDPNLDVQSGSVALPNGLLDASHGGERTFLFKIKPLGWKSGFNGLLEVNIHRVRTWNDT